MRSPAGVVSYKLKSGPFLRAAGRASWLSTVSENCLGMRRGVRMGALLVEWWRSSSSVCAGVLDVRYSTFALLSASWLLRVLAPRPL